MMAKCFWRKFHILCFVYRVDPDTPGYDEPKFIVFYRMLFKIFALFCFTCKAENPHVSMQQNGTMVTVTQHCPKCAKGYVWRSQPFVHGKYPAGNVLLSRFDSMGHSAKYGAYAMFCSTIMKVVNFELLQVRKNIHHVPPKALPT